MDVPPMTPPPVGVGRDVLTADAYELFWNCLENDTPAGDDALSSDDATDAYDQFWLRADA